MADAPLTYAIVTAVFIAFGAICFAGEPRDYQDRKRLIQIQVPLKLNDLLHKRENQPSTEGVAIVGYDIEKL